MHTHTIIMAENLKLMNDYEQIESGLEISKNENCNQISNK